MKQEMLILTALSVLRNLDNVIVVTVFHFDVEN